MHAFDYSSKNCWEVYNSNQDETAINQLSARYLDFLGACKTERETVAYVAARLEAAGFSAEGFGSGKGMRNIQGKAIFAAARGGLGLSAGLRIIFAHTDTPRLDLKQRPLQEQSEVAQFKTHYYGGIRKYQWFARPLALHGVIIREDGASVRVTLGEAKGEPVFAISDLLPHLASAQMDQPLRAAFEAEKMNLIIGHKPEPVKKRDERRKKEEQEQNRIKNHILRLLHAKYGIVEEDLYSAELQAVPAGPAVEVGLDGSLLGGYGQDDRINVFLGLEALLASLDGENSHSCCLVFLDKEEIGSEGSTGAKSRFFEYCVQDVIAAFDPGAGFAEVMLASRALSADVHAAVDPDWQDLHEKLNSALLGHGPCFCKFTGSRGKYEANDAHPEYFAWLRGILNKAGIPWQMAELGKVDGGGGGTVAMHFAGYGMNIIDCGPAVLSMHSPFELTSKVDLYATWLAFKTFFSSR
ncbi:MAG: aminopeptidase [Deltaproteobacteria bacterium]|jgi:aspartyl aminopeptidase|nr:aminopeptidase [Deltaproteobacteria bacterium]